MSGESPYDPGWKGGVFGPASRLKTPVFVYGH
jgi:hypothetical protein